MALWGNKDQANNSPLFGPALVNKTLDDTNRNLLYENNTSDAFITGETVGVYGNQVTEEGPSGWVLKRTGSGGRAGRTFSEVLVAMGSIFTESGGATNQYWFNILNGINAEYGLQATVDSQNNIFVTGFTNTDSSGSDDFFTAKFNSSGELQWQRLLGGLGSDVGLGIATDSLGNVYVCGSGVVNPQNASADIIVIKYDTNGNLLWQKALEGVGSSDVGQAIVVDSLNNIYVNCATASQGEGSNDILIVKYDSDGNLIWQKLLGAIGNDGGGYQIDVDSFNNIYICCLTNSQGEGSFDMLVVKYNSSGELQWQKLLGDITGNNGNGIHVDSLNNICICGNSNNRIFVAKYNNTGTLLWQKVILDVDAIGGGISIYTDSNNNIFVSGYSNIYTPSGYNGIIIKLDTDGNLLFIRGVGTTSTSDYNDAYGLTIDSNDNIIITGEHDFDGDSSFYVAKLPNDGSLTGTYSNINYWEYANLNSNNATLVSNTATLVSNTATLTANTATLTDKAGNLVSTLITIGP